MSIPLLTLLTWGNGVKIIRTANRTVIVLRIILVARQGGEAAVRYSVACQTTLRSRIAHPRLRAL